MAYATGLLSFLWWVKKVLFGERAFFFFFLAPDTQSEPKWKISEIIIALGAGGTGFLTIFFIDAGACCDTWGGDAVFSDPATVVSHVPLNAPFY